MKALSIRQPWAWLILNAGKDIENRNWSTRYRGEFLIHAAKGMTRDEYYSAVDTALLAKAAFGSLPVERMPPFVELQRGGIVGIAEIVDCIEQSDSPWFFGRYGFVLRNVRPLPFRPFKGTLSFFDVSDAEAA